MANNDLGYILIVVRIALIRDNFEAIGVRYVKTGNLGLKKNGTDNDLINVRLSWGLLQAL